MGEQEELLSGVTTARDLMHSVVELQNRINRLTTQFAEKTEKKTKRHPLLYAVLGFLIAFTLITSTPLKAITYPVTIPFFATGGTELQLVVWNVVNLVVSAIIGVILYRVIARMADKNRAQKNAAIEQKTRRLMRVIKHLRSTSNRRSRKSLLFSSDGRKRLLRGIPWTTTTSRPLTFSSQRCATIVRRRYRRWSIFTKPRCISAAWRQASSRCSNSNASAICSSLETYSCRGKYSAKLSKLTPIQPLRVRASID